MTWHRPSSLEELLSLKGKYPGAKIVVGNSEIGKLLIIKLKMSLLFVNGKHVLICFVFQLCVY